MRKIIIILMLIIFKISFSNLEDYTLENESKKKDIKILQELKVTTLNPIKLSDIYSKRAFRYLYDTLFIVDELGNIKLQLAKEYKYLDEKNLYIKLREKLKFQDGTELTSKEVKNSIMSVKEKGALKDFYKNIKNIEVLSKYELIIRLEKEDKYLLNVLAHSMSSIIKVKNEKIIGTGKYQVELFQKDNLILKNIDDSERKIILDRVFSKKERMLSLFNNNSDIIYDITKFDIERGKKLGIIDEKNINIEESENIVTSALIFNKHRDLEFKKNIEGLIHEEAQYILPTEIYGKSMEKLDRKKNIESIKKYINSLEKKERIIELMILNTEEDRKYAQEIKEDLIEGGITVKITPYQVEAFYHKLKEKEFDIALQHLVFNKKYPQISLGKIILYDIYDEDLYKELNFYINKLEKEKNIEKKRDIFIESVNKISKKLPYIPLRHESLYILKNKNIEL